MSKNNSGIVLFSKQPGITSFSSLYTIKHALGTKKVGHTGTLDSFAQGLLVVCTGFCTRLVPYITAFDKTYQAVIEFGSETDTLDPTGKVVETCSLPSVCELKKSVSSFSGKTTQFPPAFSAIKIGGKKSSDLARCGKTAQVPSREIEIYSSRIIEMQDDFFNECVNEDSKVKYAKIDFHVSKGTYIRSLARDIAKGCGSCAHLIGLLRTGVGNFSIEDSCGNEFLEEFSIENCVKLKKAGCCDCKIDPEKEKLLEVQVVEKMKRLDRKIVLECGFVPVELKKCCEEKFFNGQKLGVQFFDFEKDFEENKTYAVFCENDFCGLVERKGKGLCYLNVVQRAGKDENI